MNKSGGNEIPVVYEWEIWFNLVCSRYDYEGTLGNSKLLDVDVVVRHINLDVSRISWSQSTTINIGHLEKSRFQATHSSADLARSGRAGTFRTSPSTLPISDFVVSRGDKSMLTHEELVDGELISKWGESETDRRYSIRWPVWFGVRAPRRSTSSGGWNEKQYRGIRQSKSYVNIVIMSVFLPIICQERRIVCLQSWFEPSGFCLEHEAARRFCRQVVENADSRRRHLARLQELNGPPELQEFSSSQLSKDVAGFAVTIRHNSTPLLFEIPKFNTAHHEGINPNGFFPHWVFL